MKKKPGRVVDESVLVALRAGMKLGDIRAIDAHNAGLSLRAARCRTQRERETLAALVRCQHCQAVHMLDESGELVELRHYTTCPTLRWRR